MKFPSIFQIARFWKVFSPTEKKLFLAFFVLFLLSGSFLFWDIFFHKTQKVPDFGGKLREGVLGSLNSLNPLYSFYSEVDETVVDLIFCSLFESTKEGKVVPSAAKNYQVLEQGKVFEVELRDNLFWEDKKKLDAEDVIFTVKLLQNPKVQSPWRKVYSSLDVEKISDKKIRFVLKEPDILFLENLQFKILPRHVLEKIPPQEIFFSEFNEKPIGCGKYKLKKVKKDKKGKVRELVLERNKLYFGKKPYLDEIHFLFFDAKEQLEKAVKKGKIDGFLDYFSGKKFNHFSEVEYSLPKFYGLFLNLQNPLLKETQIRQAMAFLVDKEKILKEVFEGKGEVVSSPLLPEFFGQDLPSFGFSFDPQKAKEILEKLGFSLSSQNVWEKEVKKERFEFKRDLKLGDRGEDVIKLQECLGIEANGIFGEKTKKAVIEFQERYKEEILKPQGLEKGTGQVAGLTRAKLNQICFPQTSEKFQLKFQLVTLDEPKMVKVAQIIKDDFESNGIKIEVRKFDLATLEREILPQKKYDLLLFGENLGLLQNIFPFWHSSQAQEFGLNLSNYQNQEVDFLLESYKKEVDEEKRREIVKKIQEILTKEVPSIPLVAAKERYFLHPKIKGNCGGKILSSSKRFVGIVDWFEKEKRKILWKEVFRK